MAKHKQTADIITGLDIGSNSVRVAVGQFSNMRDEENSTLQIIAIVEVPSEGVQKGQIVSIEDTVSSVSNALEQIEKIIGLPVEHVWVGVSGTQIISQESKGVIAISRTDGEISEDDIERAVDAAKAVATPLNYDILHVLPRSFAVDGQTGIKDPVGMTGIRLEVDTKIIHSVSSHIKNLTKVVYRAGIDVDDFVLSILAAGEVVTNSRQKELGCIVINIGGPTTSIVVYEDGDVLHSSVIPIGSAHVTNDLALGLKTSIDIAERVKVEYGQCVSKGVNKKETIDLKDFGAEKTDVFTRYYVNQIIEARISEILEKVDDELASIERSGMLPAGAIFIGGGSKIEGIIDIAKEVLSLPAQLGYPLGLDSINNKINDISFVSAIGMVKWGSTLLQSVRTHRSSLNIGSKILDKIHKIFKNLMP
ncbi:MAG: cell division protein FtsA [Candidatus Magasanikbacteria bacterium CG_4_10_14_0_8_um_filter_32_14]|uniref:Cell division protein FtsA n=1 Tax=Candidatus Magasanikbacteria bacterium CG_4_10_14_0_8_um_filter_32_14 TaxID=1974640 RepID=A0A2M7R9Y3_9BACT|nr:MAG: cell division protein FtsA [Candidatus Magasanikbacteria bacterium CG_4_10_14_0_8_um_filter_32_14]